MPYVNGSKKCNICVTERLHLFRSKNSTTLLNSRSEIYKKASICVNLCCRTKGHHPLRI